MRSIEAILEQLIQCDQYADISRILKHMETLRNQVVESVTDPNEIV